MAAYCAVLLLRFFWMAVKLPKLLIDKLPSSVVSLAVLPLAVNALLPVKSSTVAEFVPAPLGATTICHGRAMIWLLLTKHGLAIAHRIRVHGDRTAAAH